MVPATFRFVFDSKFCQQRRSHGEFRRFKLLLVSKATTIRTIILQQLKGLFSAGQNAQTSTLNFEYFLRAMPQTSILGMSYNNHRPCPNPHCFHLGLSAPQLSPEVAPLSLETGRQTYRRFEVNHSTRYQIAVSHQVCRSL